MWPPPKPPPPRAGGPTAQKALEAKTAHPTPVAASSGGGKMLGALAALALGAAAVFGPPALIQHLTVFLLACVVGWHLVWSVTPALHTPLMSVTNAISGIILIGGMLALFGGGSGALALGGVAILVAAINVAGGFLVTQRMLRMFRK
jgi:H+-translocating NAD(P) transhydrogenase subunit alpha